MGHGFFREGLAPPLPFYQIKANALYIINFKEIVYHQIADLYIINTKCCISSISNFEFLISNLERPLRQATPATSRYKGRLKNQGECLVYHQFQRNFISSNRRFVYHQHKVLYIINSEFRIPNFEFGKGLVIADPPIHLYSKLKKMHCIGKKCKLMLNFT